MTTYHRGYGDGLPNPKKPKTTIDAHTRARLRKGHSDMVAARHRAGRVRRADGTDNGGHPGIEAANLEGWLGNFTIPLLDALEEAEAELESRDKRQRGMRWRVGLFIAITVAAAFAPAPWGLIVAAVAYLALLWPVLR